MCGFLAAALFSCCEARMKGDEETMATKNELQSLQFSTHEYDSLRSEITSRIEYLNQSTASTIIACLSAWTIGVALNTAVEEFGTQSLLFFFMAPVVFLLPIFCLVPLSAKTSDNVEQVTAIAAYIKVFYEYRSLQNGKELLQWETTNAIHSPIYSDKRRRSWVMNLYSAEYVVFSILSLLVSLFTFMYIAVSKRELFPSRQLHICYMVIFIILLIVMVLFICGICWISRSRNSMRKLTVEYLELYISRAVQIGIIPNEEAAAEALIPHELRKFRKK